MVSSIWVADLRISRATAEKIQSKHGLNGQQVKDAVVAVRGLTFVWDDRPDRGLRAVVETFIDTRRVLVVIRPRPYDAYGDSWTLVSAYPI